MNKIIIADDDQFMETVYRVKFARRGFEVRMAADGDEVFRLLKTFTPDIILLDLVMPHTDGFMTLIKMRRHEKFKHIPIVVASNLGQQEDIDRALALGANDYVTKSDMTVDAIIDKVNAALNKTK